jgi:hypothetical protein
MTALTEISKPPIVYPLALRQPTPIHEPENIQVVFIGRAETSRVDYLIDGVATPLIIVVNHEQSGESV